MNDRLEVLIRFYEVQASQARQHEMLRERVVSLFLVVVSAVVALIGTMKFHIAALPVALAVPILARWVTGFSLKHYERARYHTAVLRMIRNEVDKQLSMLAVTSGTFPLPPPNLTNLVRSARKWHRDNFKFGSSIIDENLHDYWARLPIFIGYVGYAFAASIIAIWLGKNIEQVILFIQQVGFDHPIGHLGR